MSSKFFESECFPQAIGAGPKNGLENCCPYRWGSGPSGESQPSYRWQGEVAIGSNLWFDGRLDLP